MTIRPLHKIAQEIRANWNKPNYAAIPYLDAMSSLNHINDKYYENSGKSIVAYFLGNATSWRGETTRVVKGMLK